MTPLPPDAALKILLIDENPIRRSILEAGLREAGFANVVLVTNTSGLLTRSIASIPPAQARHGIDAENAQIEDVFDALLL